MTYSRIERGNDISEIQVLQTQVANTVRYKMDGELEATRELGGDAHRVFETTHGDDLPVELAHLQEEASQLKKRPSPNVLTPEIGDLCERCRRMGALARKLCGAGSAVFLLMVVPPDRRSVPCEEVGGERRIAFRIEHSGSVVSHRW